MEPFNTYKKLGNYYTPTANSSQTQKQMYWNSLNNSNITPASDRKPAVTSAVGPATTVPALPSINNASTWDAVKAASTAAPTTADSMTSTQAPTSSMTTGGSMNVPSTSSSNTNMMGGASTPQAPQSTAEDRIMQRLQTMRDALAQKTEAMKADAANVNHMNQSQIHGTLGRVFGANSDTSEAAPITAENARYAGDLRQIGAAAAQSEAQLSTSAMSELEQALQREQENARASQAQAFNQAVQQASLTGNFNGANTMDMLRYQQDQKNADYAQKSGDRNYDLANQAQTFDQKMGILDQMLKQNQLSFDQYSGLRDQALKEATLTGMYNGAPTQSENQRVFENGIAKAALTGMYGGEQTTAEQQRQYQNLLSEAALTGMFGNISTLDNRKLAQDQGQFDDQLAYQYAALNDKVQNGTATQKDMTDYQRLSLLSSLLNTKQNFTQSATSQNKFTGAATYNPSLYNQMGGSSVDSIIKLLQGGGASPGFTTPPNPSGGQGWEGILNLFK